MGGENSTKKQEHPNDSNPLLYGRKIRQKKKKKKRMKEKKRVGVGRERRKEGEREEAQREREVGVGGGGQSMVTRRVTKWVYPLLKLCMAVALWW